MVNRVKKKRVEYRSKVVASQVEKLDQLLSGPIPRPIR
jgi:hypothetical protein